MRCHSGLLGVGKGVKFHMRPSQRWARVASELFPAPTSVLPAADPWSLPTDLVPASARSAARLAAVLTKKDFQTGWHLFSTHRRQFSPEMLSRLLAIVPSGVETAHVWWPRALQIKDAIAQRAHRAQKAGSSILSPNGLNTHDYAVLLNLAGNSQNLREVERLWLEMTQLGVPRDTNAWNQYIAAVCDANPLFWPWPRSRSTSFTQRAPSHAGLVRPQGQVLALLDRMEVEGVARDTRTFELVLLSLAREGFATQSPRTTATLEQLAMRIFGSQPPTLSALTAIVNSFALHGQLVAGFRLAQQLTEKHSSAKLGLNSPAAHQFWSRLLRLIVAQTEPRGNVPTGFFDEVWGLMGACRYVPSVGCQSIRIEYYEMKNQFEAMLRAVPEILPVSEQLAQSAVRRAIVGLANTGRAMEAVKQLQWVRTLGLEPTSDLDAFLAERGATLQQLQLFEEDDDEDSFI